jgi:DNA helicase II / ATP-dependent DNA helicase PcrA
MGLTKQQRAAVDCEQSAAIHSCPGSGKTRTIVSKLLACLDHVIGTTRRVAAITYTNAAVEEIESRLWQLCTHEEHSYYEVCTIHSFCLNNMLRPFHELLPEFGDGYELIPPDDEGFRTKTAQLVKEFSVPRWALDGFEMIQRGPDGIPMVPDGIPIEAAEELCAWCDLNGYVTLPDILYHSLRLARDKPFVASGLASRFAWVLVDEFQDSSTIQVEILKLIAAYRRSHFFIVGDPFQSIFRFAGAESTLMNEFADAIGARTDLPLTGNFRSCPGVIATAESLCPRTPRMQAVGEYKNYPARPKHIEVSSVADAITGTFLPMVRKLDIPYGKAAVLASSWFPLFPLARELRKRNVSVIGPGARPYKRSHSFSWLAEPICAYLESAEPEIALAVQRALFVMLRDITDQSDSRVFSYQGKRTVCELLKRAKLARKKSPSATDWLATTAESFTETLLAGGYLPMPEATALVESARSMCDDISRNQGTAVISTEELGLFARPKNCLFLTTIHKSKGREFEAVAIIDLHDGKIPFFTWDKASTRKECQARWEDARRLLYVGITRAKRELLLITEESNRNGPSPFLEALSGTLS